jgi:hypothetical protein
LVTSPPTTKNCHSPFSEFYNIGFYRVRGRGGLTKEKQRQEEYYIFLSLKTLSLYR